MSASSVVLLVIGMSLLIAMVIGSVALPARLAEGRRLDRCRRADVANPRQCTTSDSPVGSRDLLTRRCPSGVPPLPPEAHNDVRAPESGGHAAADQISPRRKHSRPLRGYREELGVRGETAPGSSPLSAPRRTRTPRWGTSCGSPNHPLEGNDRQ